MLQVPPGWSVMTLNELQAREKGAITDGPFGSNLTSAHYTVTGPRVVRLQNIGDGAFIDAKAHISEEHFQDLRKHEVQAGDLLVASLGETLPRVCLAPEALGPAIVKADCIRVRPDPAIIDRRFLAYWMQAPALREWATERVHGVGRPRLGLKTLRTMPVPVPSLAEQERIVGSLEGHLSRLDVAAVDLARAARLLDVLLSAGIESAFRRSGGPLRRMADVARWGSGGTPKAGVAEYYVGGTIPWLNSGDLADAVVEGAPLRITDAGLATSSAKWVPPGSVLVAMYGATIGRLGIARTALTTNQAIAFATPGPNMLTDYLFWFLRSQRPRLVAAGKGGAQPNISQSILKQWQIPVPSLDQQEAVVREVGAIAGGVGRLRAQLDEVHARGRNLRQGLLTAAFTGHLTGSASADVPLKEVVSV